MINGLNYIYGLVIAAILIILVMTKYANRKIAAEWILTAVLIGISALPVGLFLSPLFEIILRLFQMEGISQIFSIILVFFLMSICYTYLKKESSTFFMKVSAVSFITLLIVFMGWFEINAYEHEEGTVIFVNQYDTASGEYVDITKYMEEYPALEKAIKGEGCEKLGENRWYCKTPSDEWRRSIDFISIQNIKLYKIGEKYFEFSFATP